MTSIFPNCPSPVAMFLAKTALRSSLLVTLFACASPPPPPSQAEIKQAQQDYSKCLHRAATDLDDGLSDTTSVARAVRSYCAPEYQRMVDLQSQGMKPEAMDSFREKARANELEESTAAVLQDGREHKAPAQQ